MLRDVVVMPAESGEFETGTASEALTAAAECVEDAALRGIATLLGVVKVARATRLAANGEGSPQRVAQVAKAVAGDSDPQNAAQALSEACADREAAREYALDAVEMAHRFVSDLCDGGSTIIYERTALRLRRASR